MATLEDKILGERRENYCSSSEESEHEDSDVEPCTNDVKEESKQCEVPINEWNGSATNTGPKGVLNDWQQYKIHQEQTRKEKEISRLAQIQAMSITCQSLREEELQRKKQEEEEKELAELEEDDGFLLEYQKQKMKQMYERMVNKEGEGSKIFGNLIHIHSSDQFLTEIDNEAKHVTIVVHLSDESKRACRTMNENLNELSKLYVHTKFCALAVQSIDSSVLSSKFRAYGIPALLVYKNQNVIGNFVKIIDELGEVFYVEDLEGFLIDHGILVDRQCVPGILKPCLTQQDDSD